MSIGGTYYQAVNDATTAAIAQGVVAVVAAGNSGTDACTISPASTPGAITVAASTISDAHASYSDYGKCVDLYAPGSDIWSCAIDCTTCYRSATGTSMATPHVAGAAALYLTYNPTATPSQVAAAISCATTTDVITGVPTSTPNRLLYLNTAIIETCFQSTVIPSDPTTTPATPTTLRRPRSNNNNPRSPNGNRPNNNNGNNAPKSGNGGKPPTSHDRTPRSRST
jgi:subtilisin family serine protease